MVRRRLQLNNVPIAQLLHARDAKCTDFINRREKEVNKSVVQAWTVTLWHMSHYAMYVENKNGRIRYILATVESYSLIISRRPVSTFISSLKTYDSRFSFCVRWWRSPVNLNLDRCLQDFVRDAEEKAKKEHLNMAGPPDLSTNSTGKDKQQGRG